MAAVAAGAVRAQARAASAAAASTSSAPSAAVSAAAHMQQRRAIAARHAGWRPAGMTPRGLATVAAAAGGSGSGSDSEGSGSAGTRSSSSRGSGGGASSSASGGGDALTQLRGLGPVAERKLQDKMIRSLQDLLLLYARDLGGDAQRLSTFLSDVGIKKQYRKSIAAALIELAEDGELLREAERQAQAAEQADGAHSGDSVTLAVEGNISAGKSTFLSVLSHEETSLADILNVVQEPVQQWQEYKCRDRQGKEKTENVLQKFYNNPDRFAYSFQHYVLMSRIGEDIASRNAPGKLRVLERSIFSDRQVFVRAMHEAGTMEDFEVQIYNQIFNQHLEQDVRLVPDGFVYLRASPETCMQRLRRRSRSEEVGISQEYLSTLDRNHEDWLYHNTLSSRRYVDLATSLRGNPASLPQDLAWVLKPASDELVRQYLDRHGGDVQAVDWKLQVLENAPGAIKDQVLLLKGPDDLPHLRNRLALVMDHDADVDIHNDHDARRAYAEKIEAFYNFVLDWKRKEAEEQLVAQQASRWLLTLPADEQRAIMGGGGGGGALAYQ